jgi:hypothetical protein
VFGHFFYPYVSLNFNNLDIYVTPHSSHYVVDPSQDSMYFTPTFDFICVGPSSFAYVVGCNRETICFVLMFDVHCPFTYVVSIASYFHFDPSCDVMFFGFEIGEGINHESPKLGSLILKYMFFFAIDDKEMENVNKRFQKLTNMLNFKQRMFSMNGKKLIVLTPINQLLIFYKMNILLKIWWICFASCKKRW